MSDMTLGTGQLLSRIGHVYTRQHLCLMAEKGKIPWATKKGARWLFDDTGELRKWIKKTKLARTRDFKARGLEVRKAPAAKHGDSLSTAQLSKRCGLSERHVARLAISQLSEFHFLTKGGHHRFRNTEKLKQWASELNYKRAVGRKKEEGQGQGDKTLGEAALAVSQQLRAIIDWRDAGKSYGKIQTWPTADIEAVRNNLNPLADRVMEFTDLLFALEKESESRLKAQSSKTLRPALASQARGNS